MEIGYVSCLLRIYHFIAGRRIPDHVVDYHTTIPLEHLVNVSWVGVSGQMFYEHSEPPFLIVANSSNTGADLLPSL